MSVPGSTNWKSSCLEVVVNRMNQYVQRAAAFGLLSAMEYDGIGEQRYNECVLFGAQSFT